MRSQFFLCLTWTLALVSCENSLTVEKISAQGLRFTDLVGKIEQGNANVSAKCSEHLRILLLHHSQSLWQMTDSWSVYPYSGALYYASRSDWGNYDECMKIDVTHDNERIIGRYCAWGWIIPNFLTNDSTPYLLSYCVPEKCSANDLNNILGLPLFNEAYCSTKDTDTELDVGAIVAIVIFLFFFVFMTFSTAYDIYLHYAEKKSPSPIWTAFSIYTNGKKLLQTTRPSHGSEQILCFNGMKFISMWWIISGHGAISCFLAPIMNKEYRANWQTARYSQYITTAHISVDTFFFISGFLMAYLYFKQEISKKPIFQQVKSVPSLILHRYLRLTPANAMCFLGSVYLFKYLQDGPFFSYGIRTGLIEPCKKYWWTYFLYIQNYYNFHYGDSLCIPTTWYLSADMQLFLVTPLVIIPLTVLYRRSFKIVMAALIVLNLIFFGLPIFTKLHWRDYDPDFQEYDFHSKLISYFMGITFGVYLRHEKHKKIVISKALNIFMWFLSLSTMLAVMFYRQEIQIRNEYVSRSLCYSITRPMWCFALIWITFACVNGYGGVVNWFLSTSFMQIGGKLTYCLYIVHGMIIAHFSLGVKNRLHYTDWHIFYQNCGYFIVSMFVATFWSLAFESPMITIERLIFGGGKPKAPKIKVKPASVNSETENKVM